MIRYEAQTSARTARSYFREHFKADDYYSEDATVRGEWFGLGAARLGLKAGVSERAFLRLCDGLHPFSGEKLGQRLNTTRMEGSRVLSNRRNFFDFVVSPAKSVSVIALCFDERIIAAHQIATKMALKELEQFAATRVRRGNANSDRVTGEMVAALFQHATSREGDPQLHTHAVVLNNTWDQVEQRWKALTPDKMLKAQRFATAVYSHEMAKQLVKLGYAVGLSGDKVEILQVAPETRERFSTRRAQINAEEARLRSEGVEVADRFKLREMIAKSSRKRKVRGEDLSELRKGWLAQMSDRELAHLKEPMTRILDWNREEVSARSLIKTAEEHVFERKATVTKRDVLTAALLLNPGNDVSLDELRSELAKRPYIEYAKNPEMISLPEQSKIEAELIDVVRRSVGTKEALNPTYRFSARPMSREQQEAVRAVLNSKDGVMVFRGGAGTGKSHTLSEVVRGLKEAGHPVLVVAPQNQQVNGLAEDGLKAQTVTRLLLNNAKVPWGSVIIVDEAGQVSAKQMVKLTRLALLKGARLLLSGDTRQHGAVEATDALALLETYAGVKPVGLWEIRRQDPSRGRDLTEREKIARYREAVKQASDGNLAESFQLLDTAGRVHEVQGPERLQGITKAFTAAVARQERTLVVSQTWDEVNRLNSAIQGALVAEGKVSDVRPVETLQNLNTTAAQKLDRGTYTISDEIVFVRAYGRFRKGDRAQVLGLREKGLMVAKDGKVTALDTAKVDRFIVVAKKTLQVGVGDRLQLKLNGVSVEGRAFANGELVTVQKHGANGELVVRDVRGQVKTLTAQQRVFNHGYAVTSYGSQGKTVDTVLFSDSGRMGATNRKQWYVTISRGRKNVEVFTDDSRRLRQDIQRTGDREFAIQPAALVKATTKPKPTVTPAQTSALDEAAALSMRTAAYKFAQTRRATQSFGTRRGMRH